MIVDRLPPASQENDLNQPRTWIKPFYPSFNGIRGLAVLLVFFLHYGKMRYVYNVARFGWVGVDLFFCLSGFLITGILFDSLGEPKFFKNFYIRRTLRIFPLYYALLAVLAVLILILHLTCERTILFFVVYLGNFVLPFSDFANHDPAILSILQHGVSVAVLDIGHLWSLCVEEQFYLVWPAVIYLVRERRRLMQICVVGSIAAVLVRLYLAVHFKPDAPNVYLPAYYLTFARCDSLLIGSWIALWLRKKQLSTLEMRRVTSGLIWIPLLVLVVGVSLTKPSGLIPWNLFTRTFGYTLLAFIAAGVIIRSLDQDGRLAKFFKNRFLADLGKVSYGFYVFHALPIPTVQYIEHKHPNLLPVLAVLVFVLSWGAARLSFHFFESRFLRLKDVLAPSHPHRTAEPEPDLPEHPAGNA